MLMLYQDKAIFDSNRDIIVLYRDRIVPLYRCHCILPYRDCI